MPAAVSPVVARRSGRDRRVHPLSTSGKRNSALLLRGVVQGVPPLQVMPVPPLMRLTTGTSTVQCASDSQRIYVAIEEMVDVGALGVTTPVQADAVFTSEAGKRAMTTAMANTPAVPRAELKRHERTKEPVPPATARSPTSAKPNSKPAKYRPIFPARPACPESVPSVQSTHSSATAWRTVSPHPDSPVYSACSTPRWRSESIEDLLRDDVTSQMLMNYRPHALFTLVDRPAPPAQWDTDTVASTKESEEESAEESAKLLLMLPPLPQTQHGARRPTTPTTPTLWGDVELPPAPADCAAPAQYVVKVKCSPQL